MKLKITQNVKTRRSLQDKKSEVGSSPAFYGNMLSLILKKPSPRVFSAASSGCMI